MLALVAWAQDRPAKTIAAESFVIHDRTGKVRMRLFVDSRDRPKLEILDKDGRVRFSASQSGGHWRDDKGVTRLGLGTYGNGQPYLALFDANRVQRALFDLGEEDAPGIALFDNKGVLRSNTGAASVEEGRFSEASLLLFGKDGRVAWKAQAE